MLPSLCSKYENEAELRSVLIGLIMFSTISSIRKFERTSTRAARAARLQSWRCSKANKSLETTGQRVFVAARAVAFQLLDPTGQNRLTQAQLYSLFKMIVKVRGRPCRLKERLSCLDARTELTTLFCILFGRGHAQMVEHPEYRYRIASSHQTLSNLVRVRARRC